jgi:hypothetical protein
MVLILARRARLLLTLSTTTQVSGMILFASCLFSTLEFETAATAYLPVNKVGK